MDTPDLDALGSPVATGRTSEIYAMPGQPDRVVKLFLPGIPSDDAEAEAVRTGIAADAGLTTVRCHDLVSVGGRAGLLLDRLDGMSLTRMGERNPLRIPRSARALAEMHVRMHLVTAPSLPDVRDVVVDLLDRPPLGFLTDAERSDARARVTALPGGDRLLHLDYHPENVFAVAGGGYAVIDWQTAVRGVPAADVAASTFILQDAELWPGTPAVKKLLFGAIRRAYFRTYLAEYRRRTGLLDDDVVRWRLVALVLRLGWDIDSEREQLRSLVRHELAPDPQP